MKKILFMMAILLLFCHPPRASSQESADGRTTRGPLARVAYVEWRGWANALGAFFEVPRTAILETDIHRKAWPVTMLPRMVVNILCRLGSGITDIAVHPFVVPFTDDISPLTESFGLSEYPWKLE